MKKAIPVLILTLVFGLTIEGKAQYFRFDYQGADQDIQDGTFEVQVESILKFFSSLVGGGMYYTADIHGVGGFDVGIRSVIANVPDEFEGLPVFADENLLGLAFLHGSLGLPGNFEVFGRFFVFPMGSDADGSTVPVRPSDSRGGVTLIGGGLRYGVIQLPGLPKVTILGAYHSLFVPQEFDFGTVGTFSLQGVASYSLPLLTLYAGGGIDFTTLKIDDGIDTFGGERFNESETHLKLGATVKPLPLLHVSGSYTLSEFNSFELGLGVSFR